MKFTLVLSFATCLTLGTHAVNGTTLRGTPDTTATDFCSEGFTMASIGFDVTAYPPTPIQPGTLFPDNFGYGITVDVDPGKYEGNTFVPVNVAQSATTHRNVLTVPANATHPSVSHPNGGRMYFYFDNGPVDVHSVQLVDVQDRARVVVFRPRDGIGRDAFNIQSVGGGEHEIFMSVRNVRKMKVRFFAEGAVGRINMCVPVDPCGVL